MLCIIRTLPDELALCVLLFLRDYFFLYRNYLGRKRLVSIFYLSLDEVERTGNKGKEILIHESIVSNNSNCILQFPAYVCIYIL